MRGLPERLAKELAATVPTFRNQTKVKVKAPEHRYAVWLGGSAFCSGESWQQRFIDRKEYDEVGPSIIQSKCLHQPKQTMCTFVSRKTSSLCGFDFVHHRSCKISRKEIESAFGQLVLRNNTLFRPLVRFQPPGHRADHKSSPLPGVAQWKSETNFSRAAATTFFFANCKTLPIEDKYPPSLGSLSIKPFRD